MAKVSKVKQGICVVCFVRYAVICLFCYSLACILICTAVVDAPTGHVTLGAFMANGIEQKGIDSLQQCIKKCTIAGLGIPATVCMPSRPLFNSYLLSLCEPIVTAK